MSVLVALSRRLTTTRLHDLRRISNRGHWSHSHKSAGSCPPVHLESLTESASLETGKDRSYCRSERRSPVSRRFDARRWLGGRMPLWTLHTETRDRTQYIL